jgi:hypothetical protein
MENKYEKYYSNQVSSNNYPVFQSISYQQRGFGLGSLMKKLFRFIVPIIKTHAIPILKSVGETALKGANNIGKDALEGVPFKESVENRFNQSLDELTQKSNIKTGKGSVLLGSEVNTPLNNLKRKIINKLSKKKIPKHKKKHKKNKKIKADIFQ